MNFAGRFKEARLAKGLSQRALGRRIGVTGSAISQWESNDTDPANIKASILEKAASEVGRSVKWLLTGRIIERGEIAEPKSQYLRPLELWSDPESLPPDQYIFLPRLEYHLSAGTGGFDPDASEVSDTGAAFRADFAAAEGWTPKTHFTMRASGESMEPTIQDGAPVVIATNDRSIKSGKIYAFLFDGQPMLKRLDRLPGGVIRVRSDNQAPNYAAYEVSEASIEIIGRAVWTPVRL